MAHPLNTLMRMRTTVAIAAVVLLAACRGERVPRDYQNTPPAAAHPQDRLRVPVRLVFFGTPEFAVPSLEAVARAHDVALVVAQPDKPAGRGMKLQAPAVAVKARELGLPLAQPAKIRNEEFLSQ